MDDNPSAQRSNPEAEASMARHVEAIRRVKVDHDYA